MKSGCLFLTLVFSLFLLLPGYAAADLPAENEHTLADAVLPAEDAQLEAELIEEGLGAHEEMVRNQSFFEDAALEKYLNEVAEPFIRALGLSPEKRPAFKICRNPVLNAETSPSGFIYYYSGVLARIENEAQLAFVLAHEISHWFYRDSLYTAAAAERKKKKSAAYDILLNRPARFSDYGQINKEGLRFSYEVSMGGFGQKFETRADLFAVEQIVKLGYDPSQGIALLDLLMDEKNRYDPEAAKEETFFYSDHPSGMQRKKDLREWISRNQELIQKYNASKLNGPRYLQETYRQRREDVKLNLDWHRPMQAKDRALRLIHENAGDPYAYYYLGEAIRNILESGVDHLQIGFKNNDGGYEYRELTAEEKTVTTAEFKKGATEAYRKAIELDPAFSLPHRGLGFYSVWGEDLQAAKLYFEKYLQMEPQAKDRRNILYSLNEIAEGRKPS